MPLACIPDSCFLIDWSRYRHRFTLTELYKPVYVLRDVLDELRTSAPLEYVSRLLGEEAAAIYAETVDEAEEARRLVEASISTPHARRVDYPEALCLTVARRRGCVVLTENRGALSVGSWRSEYRRVRVMNAIRVLAEAVRCRLLDDFTRALEEYESDTGHVYSAREVEEVRRMLLDPVEDELYELRARSLDRREFEKLPRHVQAAVELFMKTGDLRLAQKLSSLDLESFVDVLKRCRVYIT